MPLLLLQTASVVFLWSMDSLASVSQTIFTFFLASDLLSFGLMAHVFVTVKRDSSVSGTTLLAWGLAVFVLFAAGILAS